MTDSTEIKFMQIMHQTAYLKPEDRLLVAVSGGSDSMALLNLLLHLPDSMRPKLFVATVDFALRSSSSKEVAAVRQFCQQRQIPFWTTRWQHATSVTSMEAQARQFRYNFFQQIMQKNQLTKLATAHQADDQAETILMKLIRSGSFWAVQGIVPFQTWKVGQLVRPLLNFTKKELQDYLHRQHLSYAVDESNFQDITWRNRLRHYVLPQLQRENPRLHEHLQQFSQQQISVQNLLQQYFKTLITPRLTRGLQGWQLDLQDLLTGEPVQLSLLVQYLVHDLIQVELTGRQLAAVQQLFPKANGLLKLTGDWQLQKSYRYLFLLRSAVPTSASTEQYLLQIDQQVLANDGQKFTIKQSIQKSPKTFYYDHWPRRIVLRHRQPGDQVRLLNGQHQKLKARLINLKIPQWQRDQLWLILFDQEIVWIPQVYRYQTPSKKFLFEVKWERNN